MRLADGTFKPISQVSVGDHLLSLDERTNLPTTALVRAVLIERVPETLVLSLSNGESLEASSRHRFLTGNGTYLAAGRLTVTHPLATHDGVRLRVSAIHKNTQPVQVYNLRLDGPKTFLVGRHGVAAHVVKE